MRSAEMIESNAQPKLPPGVRVGVLLLHGLTGMPNEMRPLAQAMEAMGCTVEVPMLPGHGGGHKELLATGWKDWVAGARQSLDNLLSTCDRVVIGGLSMGAITAVLLASENEKVAGVVAMSTTIRYDGKTSSSPLQKFIPLVDLCPKYLGAWFWWTEEPPYGLRDKRLQRIIARQLGKAQERQRTDFGQFRTYVGSLRQLQHMLKVVKREAPKVKCPVLIIHSKEDTITSAKNADILYEWLGTNDKRIILLEGCDHIMTLDLKRDEVAQHFASFVSQVVS